MKIYRNLMLCVFLIGMAFSTLAGEDAKHVMAVEVIGDGSGDTTSFFLDSNDLGFELDELQVGETRSIVDESGRSILISRTEDGFSFNIDGKIIDLPDFVDADADAMHWVSDDFDSDANVHVVRDVKVETLHSKQGTVILSTKPIDEATQQSIKSILESSGYGNDVEFINHEEGAGHAVKVKKVQKVVEAPQS
ncbi:MAG: hypothetical protein ACR2QS_14115 [Woeseiaceae bacterium]